MKQLPFIIAVVVLVGCGTTPEPTNTTPEKLIADPIVEMAIRESLNKPTGELTEADLANVRRLELGDTKITDVGLKDVAKLQKLIWLASDQTKITDMGLKELAKMKQLESISLLGTKITKAGVDELAKALLNGTITSNPTK